jgi:hypothetical protein
VTTIDLEVRECVDRNLRLPDPPPRPAVPAAVPCDECGQVLVGIVAVVDHYVFDHPTTGTDKP